VRIALAQVNPTVGDLEGNACIVSERIAEARSLGASLVALPELVISGYPPEDLLFKEHFLTDCAQKIIELAEGCHDIVALVGVPWLEEGLVYNAAAVLAGGKIAGLYRKMCLPNYAVFDEKRYFVPGTRATAIDVGGMRIGINICADIWDEGSETIVAPHGSGVRVIINLSMSPYHMGKGREREEILSQRARRADCYVCYLNGVGGQDELVFDGQSLVLDPAGLLLARAEQFREQMLVVDLPLPARSHAKAEEGPGGDTVKIEPIDVIEIETPAVGDRFVNAATSSSLAAHALDVPLALADCLSLEAEIYEALCVGVRDYVRKNRFSRVVLGISGGLDSALVACIAADTLGSENVSAVSMPSRFSSEDTRSDARWIAELLGIDFREIAIEDVFKAYLSSLEGIFPTGTQDVTEQNVQARIRGNLLMALSNKLGWLVLTASNKSEMAVGYSTLYGDMAGGFAVLKDVPKTLVYRLARYRNSLTPGPGPIPESTIARAPSAELAENQTDQDVLPPYEVLDRIVEAYVERDECIDTIVALGIECRDVERVVAMIDGNEYKRRQAAPGVRITPKAFGKDRRLPITNRYRG
jgi:NAD+ synthase (glutamine-hydrolysing)